MVNEDIVTSLRNSISRGETLDEAKKVMINSGYNPQDVEQASQFVGGGVISNQNIQPEEYLAMPNQKGVPPGQPQQPMPKTGIETQKYVPPPDPVFNKKPPVNPNLPEMYLPKTPEQPTQPQKKPWFQQPGQKPGQPQQPQAPAQPQPPQGQSQQQSQSPQPKGFFQPKQPQQPQAPAQPQPPQGQTKPPQGKPPQQPMPPQTPAQPQMQNNSINKLTDPNNRPEFTGDYKTNQQLQVVDRDKEYQDGKQKKSRIKEIVLLILLLGLIGLLILTVVFRDKILGWFP